MKMIKTLKCDFARILFSPEALAAVLATAVLCFSVQVYVDRSTSKAYSVLEALFLLEPAVRAKIPDLSAPMIIRNALTGYSSMALPVTASFPFVISFIAERSSGNMLYTHAHGAVEILYFQIRFGDFGRRILHSSRRNFFRSLRVYFIPGFRLPRAN